MRDIEKTNMSHDANSRRDRLRKRGRPIYVLLAVVLAFAVIVTLSMTLLFNIKTIRMTGDEIYSPDQILQALGISEGDNMMRLNLTELEETAESQLKNAETVTLRRQFPSTLIIDVKMAVPSYNISYEYGTLIVSQKGKILQNSMDPMPGLINISGYVPKETTPGKRICAEEERYDRILSSFQDLIQSGTLKFPIVSVNMKDLNDIVVNFDHRIEFDMGNWSEINYKISFAEYVISEQPEDREGFLTMIGSKQCSFRSKEDVENAKKSAERKAAAQLENELAQTTTDPLNAPVQTSVATETVPISPGA